MRRRLLTLVAAAACALAAAGPAGAAPDLAPYAGLGSWVDLYDRSVWADPAAAVARMREHGVSTVFVETGSWRRRESLVDPRAVGWLLDAAHAAGLAAVAWTLPSFADGAGDLRRAVAAIRYRSPAGGRFDSFALDIESPVVRSPALRTARLLGLADALRRAAGPAYALGAIIPSPRGLELARGYWPRFPYRQLAAAFDVFLPMTYFTYRSGRLDGARRAVERNAALIRAATGERAVPVHAIGGLAGDARAGDAGEFAAGALAAGLLGASLYDFAGTTEAQWRDLAGLAGLGAGALNAPPEGSPGGT